MQSKNSDKSENQDNQKNPRGKQLIKMIFNQFLIKKIDLIKKSV
jgi:hypothetical protein